MNNIFIRIAIISFALIGVYKMFPQVSRPVDYYIKNPQFQTGVLTPSIKAANAILPPKLQIPTPEVMGASTEYSSAESPIKSITDEITRQAASLAAEQIAVIKKTASDQFCATLIEKIKSECGQ